MDLTLTQDKTNEHHMNRFGPTTTERDRAIERAVNSWMAGRHLHIDTIFDLQAHGYGLEQLASIGPTEEPINE